MQSIKDFGEDILDKCIFCPSPNCKYFDKSVCTLYNKHVIGTAKLAICNSFEERKD